MAAVSHGNGALELIALGNDGKLYHWRYQESTWTGPVLVGIGIISAPALVYALGEQKLCRGSHPRWPRVHQPFRGRALDWISAGHRTNTGNATEIADSAAGPGRAWRLDRIAISGLPSYGILIRIYICHKWRRSMVERGQVVTSAAEVYEEFFLPALFQEWASRVADSAQIQTGDRVLDVACGTGVLARTIHDRVGPGGSVVGIDVNESMLAVAKSKAPEIEWRKARAEELPFEDDVFDAVVSQFGLMFFADRLAALKEMKRVLRRGGKLSVAVWGELGDSPGYAAMTELLRRLFGDQAAGALEAPFALGDRDALRRLFADASMDDANIITEEGRARFPSLQAWVYTEIKGWTLAEVLDDAQYQLLLEESEQELKPFVNDDDSVSSEISAHIVTWRKSLT